MICLCCQREFTPKKIHGGNNRILCYECLPEGLPTRQRDNIRKEALSRASDRYKQSIGCQKCGYDKCASALEWHHKDDNKEGNPSHFKTFSWKAYMKEVEKCVLLCANCHREFHDLAKKIDIVTDDFLKLI